VCQADHLSRGFLLSVVCQTEYDREALRVGKRTWPTTGLSHSWGGEKKKITTLDLISQLVHQTQESEHGWGF